MTRAPSPATVRRNRPFRSLAALLTTTAVLLPFSGLQAAAAPKVVASIKPVHSLVAAVMQGVGEPDIIVDGAASPHTFALKPSTARVLAGADLVFWVGPELEAFLEKPIKTLGEKAEVVELSQAHDLTLLPVREGGDFDEHDHGEGGHAHGSKDAKAGHDHGHNHSHSHSHDHGHAHGAFDAHLWLDPANARAMVHEIEEHLTEADPANAATYKANAEALTARLTALEAELTKELEPVKGKPFIVFHDAYQYFEKRFGIQAAGSITLSPEVMPGAERVSELRSKITSLKAGCVFSEPQFEPKLVGMLIEGTSVGTGVLDPLGASLPNGPGLYEQLLRDMAGSLKGCLAK
ncbi:zinc ABC transporter substrate-binding protein ZnuA [Pannonibacter carbonis]|uniref:zinc ABC transporter substrate-binding protein ZnuA n=1 Tax=Pannonibacter carbonis TaxID=2067569 RepID=UPI000D0FFA24|nr:zinc ABC transporter substrate-binding protein ZnuA [Pannonibacter carbonis]